MGDTFSADVNFVLAALRCTADAALAQRAAATQVTDWPAVVDFALSHDVGWWTLRALPEDGVPAADRERLTRAVRDVAMSALAGARQLAELHRAFAAAGVRVVAYKGPALAADVHGDLGARFQTDLDLLVPERERYRAITTMQGIGYALADEAEARAGLTYSRWEGVTHLARGDEWPVELHWRCQAPRYGGPQDPAAIVARARRCALAGGTVLVPSPEDLAVLLALHGVKHGWTSLMWVVDLAAALSRPEIEWSMLAQRADAWGVQRALSFALLVVHELGVVELPTPLLERARGDRRAVSLSRAVTLRLTRSPNPPDIGAESTPRYDLQWLDGTWARLRYLSLAAALPTPQDRRSSPLPDLLLPLAYPLRAWRLMGRAFGRRT